VTDLQAAGVPDAVIIGKVGERKGNLFLRVV
jgi:hypothetical protein